MVAGHPGAPRARLLVLGAGPAQLGLLEAAASRGLEVIAADRDPGASGFALASERALISTEDELGIERLARARRVDGIISPGADWPVGIAARVAERMGLPHPIDAAVAAVATSKSRQRDRFVSLGVPHAGAHDPDAGAVLFPCVVKAPDRQGQRGLTLVRDAEELEQAVAEARSESRSGVVIVEELVEGPEVTVNAVSVDGSFRALTVTDRALAPPPAFGVALAHVWPSRQDVGPAVAVAEAAVAAVGIRNGPTYTQVRLGPDGPRVMEVAARVGGGHDAELCEAALGVDLNGLAIRFALGEDVSVADMSRGLTQPVAAASRGAAVADMPRGLTQSVAAASGGAAVVFLVPPVGTLRAVRGLDEAAAVEGVRWARIYRTPGWRFGPLRRGADRAGAILATGATREDALARARRAAQAVRFEVDADGP